MATLPLDMFATAPSRGQPSPVTQARQRRSWTIYASLFALGTLPWLIGSEPALQAAGLGLWLPGAGFLAAGGWWALLFPLTLLLFVVALVAWFWAGMVLAPVMVWLGSAALAGLATGDAVWTPAPLAAGGALTLILAGFARRNARLERDGQARAVAREAFLPRVLPEVRAAAAAEAPVATRELGADQLAAARYLLDRALQPIERFDGFTIVDQFQPAALRYQLNHMGFALGVLQSRWLPNFRGYLGEAQRNLITKYLDRRVWDYWVLESCWGHLNFTDWNPAGRDNIMLTGWFGAHVGQYMLASGDRRYLEPGSLTFRLNARQAWSHDFTTLIGSVAKNYETAEFGHFACEPNWIYPICNHYGMLSLVTHDAVTGSSLVARHLPRWVTSMDTEFTDAAGSIIGLRSQLTGMPVPFPVGEAGYAHFENCFLPDRARRLWAIATAEATPLLVDGESGPRLAFPGAGLDAGNYKPGHTGALATYLVAAREFGDTAMAEAAARGLGHDCGLSDDGGVRRYTKGSNIANATAMMGLLMQTGDFRTSFTAPAAARGPMLDGIAYPDVLVARAWSDGEGLDLVLHPGKAGGRQRLTITDLQPGRRYAVTGALTDTLVADGDGRARFEVDLTDRTAVALRAA